MLNNSGESGHPCLVPDLRGNAFSFSPLRIMFAVGFSYMAFTGCYWWLGDAGSSIQVVYTLCSGDRRTMNTTSYEVFQAV